MNRLTAYADNQSPNAATLRLRELAALTPQELDILQGLSQTARNYPAQTELCLAGRVQSPVFLLAGWACYKRILGDGRRQIIRFILPGDAVGSLVQPAMPGSSYGWALTSVVVADARPLLRATDEAGAPLAGFAEALAAAARAEEEGLYNQIVRLGRQTAYERLIHLILELHERLQRVGLVEGNTFAMPLTQEMLADALGLSVVHVNRTLQQVRRDKLLEFRTGRVTLHQPELMRSLADWVAPMAE